MEIGDKSLMIKINLDTLSAKADTVARMKKILLAMPKIFTRIKMQIQVGYWKSHGKIRREVYTLPFTVYFKS